MGLITTVVPIISDYPKLGDTHDVFRQKADIAWNDLSNALPTLNVFADEANDLRNEVNTLRNDTKTYRDDSLSYKNMAYGYKVDAETAANSIKSYVVPTEATYSLNDLEVALNGLLTQIVAQQAQIAILKS